MATGTLGHLVLAFAPRGHAVRQGRRAVHFCAGPSCCGRFRLHPDALRAVHPAARTHCVCKGVGPGRALAAHAWGAVRALREADSSKWQCMRPAKKDPGTDRHEGRLRTMFAAALGCWIASGGVQGGSSWFGQRCQEGLENFVSSLSSGWIFVTRCLDQENPQPAPSGNVAQQEE